MRVGRDFYFLIKSGMTEERNVGKKATERQRGSMVVGPGRKTRYIRKFKSNI